MQLPSRIVIALITFYQGTFSPDHGPLRHLFPHGCCTYDETCSNYAKRVIQERGLIVGSFLAIKRILSCTPWRRPDEAMVRRHSVTH